MKKITLKEFHEMLKELYRETSKGEIVLANKFQRSLSRPVFDRMIEEQTGDILPEFRFGIYNPDIHKRYEMETLCFVYDGEIRYLKFPQIVQDKTKLIAMLRLYADNLEGKNILVETDELNRRYYLTE